MNTNGSDLIATFCKLKVLVLGEAMLDGYLRGVSDRLCQEAPVPVVNVKEASYAPGGAANTAVNVRSLGSQVSFLSVVGNDTEGNRLREALESLGVSTEHLLSEPARRTLSKQRVVAASQLLVRFDQGSISPVSPETETVLIEQLSELFGVCDAVIVSDYGYGILTPKIIKTLAELQTHTPRVLVVDSKQLSAYRSVGVTAVKPNYDEAVQLLGIKKREAGMGRVNQMTSYGKQILEITGAKVAALTLDTEGALIFERDSSPDRTYAQPVAHTQATGAGDTFVSALTLALAAGAGTSTAALLAAAATAVVVTQEGTTTCSFEALRQSVLGSWGDGERGSGGDSSIHNVKSRIEQFPVLLQNEDKLLATLSDLEECLQLYRASGYRIVFTNGCFDILHRGHVTYLKQARALGDVLIVGVNSDESVRRLKGISRPINPLGDRTEVLAALACVDAIAPFDDDTPCNLIEFVRPDVFVKGGDYTRETLPEASLVEALGGVVKILPFVGDRSTTRLIEHIHTLKPYD